MNLVINFSAGKNLSQICNEIRDKNKSSPINNEISKKKKVHLKIINKKNFVAKFTINKHSS